MKNIYKLYQNTTEIHFDTTLHRYSKNGVQVPNVSSVIAILDKPALIPWAAKMAVEYAKEQILPGKSYDEIELQKVWDMAAKAHAQKKTDAGSLGSLVHQWVSDYVTGQKPGDPINPQFKGSVDRFKEWVEKHQVEFLASEQIVYSKKNNYVGTLDAICKIDNKLYIFDLKTNNYLYKSTMGMQMAAYLEARKEEYPNEEYHGCVLVRVGKKDGEFEVWEVTDWKPYYETFLSLMYTYRCVDYLKKNKLA